MKIGTAQLDILPSAIEINFFEHSSPIILNSNLTTTHIHIDTYNLSKSRHKVDIWQFLSLAILTFKFFETVLKFHLHVLTLSNSLYGKKFPILIRRTTKFLTSFLYRTVINNDGIERYK